MIHCPPSIPLLATIILSGLLPFPSRAENHVELDPKTGRVVVPGIVAKQNVYEELKGAIEYVACCPGGKEYETLFICPIDPRELHRALVLAGISPGKPAREDGDRYVLPEGGSIRIVVQWQEGKDTKESPVEDFVWDTKAKRAMRQVDWAFTGSQMTEDPDTGSAVLQTVLVKNLISLHHLDPSVLIQNPLEEARDDSRYKANLDRLPRGGTAVKLILSPVRNDPGGVRTGDGSRLRIHWIVHGSVQGVGFRAHVQRHARSLGVRGWVRNLPNGQVELMAEGQADAMAKFQEQVRQGPRGSRVDKVETREPDAQESLAEFEVRATPL